MNRTCLIAVCVGALTLSFLACGGGSSASTMTQAQASSAFGALYDAMEGAAGTLDLARSAPASPIGKVEAAAVRQAILAGTRAARPNGLVSPAPKTLPETTTVIPPYTYTCPSGGTIVVTGSYTATGSGTTSSTSANIVEAINDCKDSGITMNGDPDIAFSVAETSSSTSVSSNITMTGGITAGSSSCSTNLQITTSYNLTSDTGTISYDGSFCGISLNGTETI